MFKLLLLLTNIFSFGLKSNKVNSEANLKQTKENNYQIICEELDDNEFTTYLDIQNNYSLVKRGNHFFVIMDGKTKWSKEVRISDNVKTAIKDNNYLLFYEKEGYLHLIEVSPNGESKVEKKIVDNKLTSDFDVILYNNIIYLVSTIDEYQTKEFTAAKTNQTTGLKDAVIIRLDEKYEVVKIKVISGSLNEEFQRVIVFKDHLYIQGIKDPLTGGDLGNGGRVDQVNFLLKIDLELENYNFIIFNNNDEIIMFNHFENSVYLITAKNIYEINEEIEIKRKARLESAGKSGVISDYQKILIFLEKEIKIYDLSTFVFEQSFPINDYNKLSIFKNIIYLENSLLSKNYFLDVIYLGDFTVLNKFYLGIDAKKIANSIFGEASLVEELSDPLFNANVHGIYELKYSYQNPFGIKFLIRRMFEVPLRVNVTEGLIYPLGYRLSFSGVAYLDGKLAINNQSLTEEGLHTLELYDNNANKTVISFYISKNQVPFTEDSYLEWDYEMNYGSSLYLYLNIKTNPDLVFKSVIINDKEYSDLTINLINQRLEVLIDEKLDAKIHNFYVTKIHYLYKEKPYSYLLNEVVVVNILKPAPMLEITEIKDKLFQIKTTDLANTIRCFKLVISDGIHDAIKRMSIHTTSLNLEDLNPNKNYQISLYLVYDLGNKKEGSILLLDGQLSEISKLKYCDIDILEMTDSLNTFHIKLNSPDEFSKLRVNDKLISSYSSSNDIDYLIIIIISLVASGLLTSIYFFIKRLTIKKHND